MLSPCPYPVCKGKIFLFLRSLFPIDQGPFMFWVVSFVVIWNLEVLLENETHGGGPV